METYNSEEEQVEAIKKWWKANGQSVITGIVAGVIIIGGWNFWSGYKTEKAEKASTMYEQLLVAVQAEKDEPVTKLADQIEGGYSSTPYAQYAALFKARVKIQEGDLEAAKAILQQAVSNFSGEMKDVARIRLIRLMLATDENEMGLQMIAEVDPSHSQSFIGNYEELKGDLYVALDRPGEARTAYQNALREGQGSPLLQFKLDDLATPKTVENTP